MDNLINKIEEVLKSKTIRKNSPMDLTNQIEEKFEDIMFGLEEIQSWRFLSLNNKNKLRSVIKEIRELEENILNEID